MRAFDDSVLLLIGSDFRAKILDNSVGRYSECVRDIVQVCDVGLNSVKT